MLDDEVTLQTIKDEEIEKKRMGRGDDEDIEIERASDDDLPLSPMKRGPSEELGRRVTRGSGRRVLDEEEDGEFGLDEELAD